jgi:hypothetical protein
MTDCACAALGAQLRNRAYKRIMSAGLSKWGRAWLSVKLAAGEVGLWNILCALAVAEKLNKWRIYGPRPVSPKSA